MPGTIYTHLNPDLDAACAVWAARRFYPGGDQMDLRFVPADWDGGGLQEGDLALDLNCGLKGMKLQGGTYGSALAAVVARWAPAEDHLAIGSLVAYVELQDTTGNPFKTLAPGVDQTLVSIMRSTSLSAVFWALRESCASDHEIVDLMGRILDGMLAAGRLKRAAYTEIDSCVEWLANGMVAIVRTKNSKVNGMVFERGARYLVYADGNNLGVLRNDSLLPLGDTPQEILRDRVYALAPLEVERGEWFSHPAGFLYGRGTRKAPARGPSLVQARQLALVLSAYCHREFPLIWNGTVSPSL